MRRSITGPLVVIGVGILFLLNNVYPGIFTWTEVYRYWPFLLIAFGAIRLLEILFHAGRAQAVPQSSLSTGGLVMLLIACVCFWGIMRHSRPWRNGIYLHDGSIEVFGEEHQFDVKQSIAVAPGDVRVILDGIRGSVTVTGDESGAISVEGHRTVRALSRTLAEEAKRQNPLELVRDGNDLVLRPIKVPDRERQRVSYDLRIRLPKRLNVIAQGATDDISVESVDGNVEITGSGGDVRLTSIGGNARVETTKRKNGVHAVGLKGNLDLRGNGTDLQIEDVLGLVTVQGAYVGTMDFRNLAKPLHFESEQTDLRVEKLPGSISMDLSDFHATNVTGPLKLRCHSRDVNVSDFSGELEIDLDRGDVEISPRRTPLAKMDVHVRAGNVDLALPEKTPFELHATTSQGEASNEYGDGVSQTSEGRSASMKTSAQGGPALTVTTDRGNITLKKS